MAVYGHTPRTTVGKPLLRPWMAPPRIPGLVARPALSEHLRSAVIHGETPADTDTDTDTDESQAGTSGSKTRGRTATLGRALDNKDTSGLVVLRGDGGYGKTTLATWLCHRRETRERFPGGLLWVTLGEHVAGAELALRINGLIERLTGNRPTLIDPGEAGEHLGALLDHADEPILLIVDDACPVQLDAFPTGNRLVLTGHDLPGIEVGPMSEHEARTLLLRDLPGEPEPKPKPETVPRWPLLLHLANRAAMRAIRHGAPPGNAGDHRLDAGLSLLPPGYRDRFAELAIFGPDVEIPLDVLHPLWGGRFGEVARICEALADLALVLRGRPGTIRLHQVIRDHLIRTTDPRLRVTRHRRLLDAGDRWHNDYLVAHLAEHLAGADRPDDLAESLTDPRRILQRLQRHGPAAVAADLAYGKKVEKSEKVQRVIQRDSHLLAPTDPPDALGAILASRLDETPAKNEHTWLVNRPVPAGIQARGDRQQWITDEHRKAHEGGIRAAAVSPDGSWMVTGGADGTVAIWDYETAKLLRRLSVSSGVTAVTPDPHWLAVGSDDGFVRIWDPESGRLLHRLRGEGPVTTMAPARDMLAAGTATGTIKIWNPRTGRALTMMRTDSSIRDCRWFDDDSLLVVAEGGTYAYRLT
jgi:hypothetical protein